MMTAQKSKSFIAQRYGGATIANDSLFIPLVPFQHFLRFTEKVLLDMRVNKN
jgi:hypothetical protein